MYKVSILVVLFFSCHVFSQKSISKDDQNSYEKEVKQTVLEFFEGFHAGDTAKMKTTIDKNHSENQRRRDKNSKE
jgi:hypothetical protein